jgi:hypothetical protein
MMLFTLIKRTLGKKKFAKESTNDLTITPESISILIPFHGEWELIGQCLNSVINQNYESEIKIFVITNKENYDKLKNLIPRINSLNRTINLLISESDQKSKKLNLCLSIVNESYVAFLDADHIADEKWISSGLKHLKMNPHWKGIQGKRSPIKKQGIIYAWDSFVNHLGNELLNLIRIKSHSSVPFTGTTAIFKKEVFDIDLFGDSITEDTEWYFKKISLPKKSEFYIGYDSQFGSCEIMSHDLNTLVKRRIRWSTGHTRAFFENRRKGKRDRSYDILSKLHGFHYMLSIPITIWILSNFLFLFLQMNLFIQLGAVFGSLGLSVIFRRHPTISSTKPWISAIFGFFFIMGFILFLNQFYNIGLDTVISRFGLLSLPGYLFFSSLGGSVFLIFFCIAWLIFKKNVKFSMFIKALLFSIFLIPVEIFTSLSGVINSFSKQSMGWNTDRKITKSFYDRVISIILIITFITSFWVLLDGRSIVSFFKDVSAIQNQKVAIKKKAIPFSKSFLLKGVAINAPLNEVFLERLSEIGVNSIRFYKDPGVKWINLAQQYGINSVLQPSFSNWDHVDVRLPWAKWILIWNLFYLDSKYQDHSSVPFLLIGNEIEIWAYSDFKEEDKKDNLRKNFFSIFKEIEQKLENTNHHFTIASTIVDSTTDSPILMPNTLTTSFQYWDDYLPTLPTNKKSTIAGEWGGFQAPDDAPPEWLRLHRSELQWQYLKGLEFVGGYYFALQDNPSQPRMKSFNDPLNNNDPEDKRGLFDEVGAPKEEFWALAYLYGPITIYKSGSKFIIENNSDQELHIGDKVIPSGSKIDGSEMIQNAKEDLYGEFSNKKKILVYHPEGRLSGCQIKVDNNLLKSDHDIFLAEYPDYQKLKVSNAKIYSGGRKGLVEIHPTNKEWSVKGIDKDSLKILKPCRKPFFREL